MLMICKFEGIRHGKRSATLVRLGATGPRTPSGKTRSKFNAIKHGIFSSAVILESESPRVYANLVSEFFEALQPEGRLEETLVEKIASTIWRQQRLLYAEAAEIDRARLLSERTFADRIQDLRLASAFFGTGGSLQKAIHFHDGDELMDGVKELDRLRQRILEEGLNWERDREQVQELFGSNACQPEAKEGRAQFYPSLMVEEISLEVDTPETRQAISEKLLSYMDVLESVAIASQERGEKLKALRDFTSLVPNEKDNERLMRYEAHLDRVLDRALTQLERLQRMRLGQPVLPPVKVEVST